MAYTVAAAVAHRTCSAHGYHNHVLSVQAIYREASGEFFAKRGICWHGIVLTVLTEGKPISYTLHDVLHSETKQDSSVVLGILEATLMYVKSKWPHITKAIIQSDNARCYGSNLFIGM